MVLMGPRGKDQGPYQGDIGEGDGGLVCNEGLWENSSGLRDGEVGIWLDDQRTGRWNMGVSLTATQWPLGYNCVPATFTESRCLVCARPGIKSRGFSVNLMDLLYHCVRPEIPTGVPRLVEASLMRSSVL